MQVNGLMLSKAWYGSERDRAQAVEAKRTAERMARGTEYQHRPSGMIKAILFSPSGHGSVVLWLPRVLLPAGSSPRRQG